jgi:hypothetical protein
MSISDLKPLAEANLPNIVFQGNTPEERLLNGFVLSKQYMGQIIPQEHTVDMSAAVAVQEGYDQQIVQNQDVVASSLSAKQDLPDYAAISAEAPKSKEYWISTYALAAEGIGAYATGYAKQQVTYGLLSEDDYYGGIDVRTKSFANIVYAGQTGVLAQLVAPESWYSSTMQNSEAARTMQLSGQLAGGGQMVVGSTGTKIFALNTTKKLIPVQLGLEPITIGIIAGAIAVAIIGVAYVGFHAWASTEKERIRASAEFMGQMCKQANDNPALSKACAEYADKITTPTPAPFGLDNLSKYLVWGAVGLAALYMLPSLMESFSEARFRTSVRKAARGQ